MPERLTARARRIMEAAAEGGEDRIGALPDELLQHIMSFLLSRDAVQTCVLARRWRILWKSVPTLRICDPESYDGATGSSTFVDDLLRLRDPTPLTVCHITWTNSYDEDCDSDWAEEAFERMEPWLQYAVSCQVQVLMVDFPLRVTNMNLISSHLKRLVLHHMNFRGCSLHSPSCQVLEVLELSMCNISADIFSPSLKHLDIDGYGFDWDQRTCIYAPNLIGLQLLMHAGYTPFLFRMPSLVTASITLVHISEDYCSCSNLACEGCCRDAGESDYSIVLHALSGASNLDLVIFDPALFVFRKDLKWRPVFSKLKTLCLNDWCVVNDFKGLIYFLQHSPILETLTIDLQYRPHEKQLVFKTDESYNPREKPLLLKHLKLVTIFCQTEEDVEVPCILNILNAHGVPSKQIVIKENN